ncbi:MAG: hypothetical protein M1832_001764 [Thelocarpon impressellum]|nr:MAG: hypothetical protein M1832_001764 [Thelocarpon impressellum]
MAGAQFLNPSAAQAQVAAIRGKAKAVQSAQEWQLTVNEKARRRGVAEPEFEFLELIGKGSFGRVFKSKHLPTNQLVAVKIIDVDATDYAASKETFMEEEESLVKLKHEVSILRSLKDGKAKNVNMIYEAFAFDHDLWIVSEYCPGGSVNTLMKAQVEPGLSEKYIIPIARELAEALAWVHSVGIIHRDVKPSNVLICEDGRVQLCDFGVSGMLEASTDKRATFIGTIHYMPLEMLAAERAHQTNAYGTELAMGAPPNRRAPTIEALAGALEQKTPRLEGGNFSSPLRDLVAVCLTVRPQERPSIQAVQQHRCLFNSVTQYPTSSLTRLLEDYYLWEQSGGHRASLFWAAGAIVSEPFTEEPDYDWNFSSSEVFDRSLEDKRASILSLRAQSAQQLPSPGARGKLGSTDKTVTGLPTQKAGTEEHPRHPVNPLHRLFDRDDNYNYLDRGRDKMKLGASTSDLPLREQNTNSSIRDTMIDLGEFDAETGTAKIPPVLTIRGSKSRNPHFQDSDDEGEQSLTYKPTDDGVERRATKDWKFPGLAEDESKRRATKDWKFPGLSEDESKRRATKDWKFPGLSDDENARRATKDWKFPGLPPDRGREAARPATQDWKFPMITSTMAEEGPLSDEDQRPPFEPVPEVRSGLLQPTPESFSAHGPGALMESVSAPVSPPHSIIDLGEYVPRPSTADSAPGPLSPELDPDNPFGPDTGSEAGPNNRFSYHKQSRSEPASLETKDAYDGNDPDAERRRSRKDGLDEDGVDQDVRPLHDRNAVKAWKRDFYEKWTDAEMFNPGEKVKREAKEAVRRRDDHGQESSGQPRGNTNHSSNTVRRGSEHTGRGSDGSRALDIDRENYDLEGPGEDAARDTARRLGTAHGSHARGYSDATSDGSDESILDFAGLERYIAQPPPLPPSATVLAEGAAPEELARELERLMTQWGEGMAAVRAALDPEYLNGD